MGSALLRADISAVSFGELTLNFYRRFYLLGELQRTPELYRFAPWFHSTSTGKQKVLAVFFLRDIFSGCLGLTLDISGKLSYQRKVMAAGAKFNNFVLLSRPF